MIASIATVPAFKPLSWRELCAYEIPELDWVVDGLLPRGSATLNAAREKAGKGLFSLDLCVSTALGESFLGRFVNQGPAIYCPGEENLREVRSRLHERIAGISDLPLFVLPLNGSTEDALRLDDPMSLARLEAMILDIEPAVLVLDPMREFHTLAEDSSDDMGPLLRPLRQMAHNTNIALVINHHMNKSGSSRGSTAIKAAFDQEFSFRRTDQDQTDQTVSPDTPPRGVLTVEGRFGPRIVTAIGLGPGLRWQVQAAPLLSPDATIRDRVLSHLVDQSAWRTAAQIADAVKGNPKTVANTISELLREATPQIVAKGTGRKGDPREFMTTTPRIDLESFLPSGSHGNHSGMKNDSQNGSRGEGYGVGNKGAGNNRRWTAP